MIPPPHIPLTTPKTRNALVAPGRFASHPTPRFRRSPPQRAIKRFLRAVWREIELAIMPQLKVAAPGFPSPEPLAPDNPQPTYDYT